MEPSEAALATLAKGITWTSQSPEETEAFASRLGELSFANLVVALHGELGAGKTCFVRGLARGLGARDRVSSPTFTLMHEYPGRLALFHFDAWMEGREGTFLEGGGAEWLQADGVAVIEWAEHVKQYLPAVHLEVRLSHTASPQRPSSTADSTLDLSELPSLRQLEVRLVGGASPGSSSELESGSPSCSESGSPSGFEPGSPSGQWASLAASLLDFLGPRA